MMVTCPDCRGAKESSGLDGQGKTVFQAISRAQMSATGRLVAILRRAGFSDNDISVIAPGDEAKHDPKIALDHKPGDDPADEKPREGSGKLKVVTLGAVSGGLILGAINGLIGLATLAIPGLSLIVVAGPIAAALTDAAAGGAAGLIAGALMGMRIPEHLAKQYEESVREGNTLISVHTRSADIVQDATREMPPPEDAPKKIPDEQLEEAEQDAADPTHEKEVPPENQKY